MHRVTTTWAAPGAASLGVLVLALAASACGGEEKKDAKPDAAEVLDAPQPGETAGPEDQAAEALPDLSEEPELEPGEVGFDIQWPTGDGGCVPQCKGKVCGPDKCGSVCGFCLSGKFCSSDGATCEEYCKPQCDGKKCGSDGCKGECGKCDPKFHCGKDFLCHPDDCVPDCKGKVCGPNGCGDECGLCAVGDLCVDGSCQAGPCSGVPAAGKCEGDMLVQCTGSGVAAVKTTFDCTTKYNKVCGWDPVKAAHDCVEAPPCEPKCKAPDGKKYECGSDGCKGVCGVCPEGWSCPSGFCVPKKGADCGGIITKLGSCQGDVWVFCNTGKVDVIDCGAADMKCGWDGGKFTCL